MFMSLLSYAVELSLTGAILYLIFQTIAPESLSTWQSLKKSKKESLNALEKISKVKLVSNDAKEIEKFIIDNAKQLSDETVDKLVDRIEVLKSDKLLEEASLANQFEKLKNK